MSVLTRFLKSEVRNFGELKYYDTFDTFKQQADGESQTGAHEALGGCPAAR